MKIESTAFTQADVENFEAELRDHERMAMADRLEKVSQRLETIGPRIVAGHGDESWSDHELLAHIAVVSKFYGVIVHKISSGLMT
jgi:transposase